MEFNNKYPTSVIDTIHQPHWVIKDWKVIFLLSERLLAEIRKISRVTDWYEDPIMVDTYIDRLNVCFNSIDKVYSTLAILPRIGDRLYNGDTGMIVQDCSFDGGLMTITFIVSI